MNEPLVMKFGGASVATPQHFLHIADIIVEKTKNCPKIVVVVSAMANMTDQLLDLATQINPSPPRREHDMLVTVGERISISLLAMALSLKGKEAVSFTGSQSGIITCENHADAKILEIRPHRILKALNENKIAIVAGFQGMSRSCEITTLGRGGSDTSAVALAIAIGADRVEFYKDVEGVFTADPKKNPSAELIPQMSYRDAMDLSAKILHRRCLALAEKNGVQLCVYPFMGKRRLGTLVGSGEKRSAVTCFETE